MVDQDLILAKASSIKKHLNRVREKSNTSLEAFLNDLDRQESILHPASCVLYPESSIEYQASRIKHHVSLMR